MSEVNISEIWVDVKGYEGKYQISSTGLARSINYNNTGKPRLLRLVPRCGSIGIALSNNGKVKEIKVHILVAQAFIPNPNNFAFVRHIDGNASNNCVDNLVWKLSLKGDHFYDSTSRECTCCGAIKPFEEFPRRSNRTSGRQPYCRECANKKSKDAYCSDLAFGYDIMRNYGLSIQQYDDIYREQGGSCAICNKHASTLKESKKKHLCVDHCHTTGKIRGLLCDSCNRALGMFRDDKVRLQKAIDYLSK